MKKTIYANGIIVGELDVIPGDHAKEIEQVTEFLRTKGIHREVTTVQAVFRQALSFCKTSHDIYARDLVGAPRNGLAAAPFAVNAAFSIELYLKTLHQLAGASVRGHQLLALYDDLPAATRDLVIRVAQERAAHYLVKPTPSVSEFRQFVADLNNAFVDWRYCYEAGSTMELFRIQPTILVMVALDQTCRELGAT